MGLRRTILNVEWRYYFQFRRHSRLTVILGPGHALLARIAACPESDGHAATIRTGSGRASLAGMTHGWNAVILAFVDLACPAEALCEGGSVVESVENPKLGQAMNHEFHRFPPGRTCFLVGHSPDEAEGPCRRYCEAQRAVAGCVPPPVGQRYTAGRVPVRRGR